MEHSIEPTNPSETSAVLSDSITVHQIRSFLRAEKDPSLTPVDVGLCVLLLARKALDHSAFDSHQTLARALRCDVQTVARSQQRLVAAGYLSAPKRKGRTNLLQLNYQEIPAQEAVALKITSQARALSGWYQFQLRPFGKKRFPKHHLQNQFFSAQRLLNLCGGDQNLVGHLILFSLHNPRFKRRALKSLYELVGKYDAVREAFDAYEEDGQITSRTCLFPQLTLVKGGSPS